jgi:hypothetical protein
MTRLVLFGALAAIKPSRFTKRTQRLGGFVFGSASVAIRPGCFTKRIAYETSLTRADENGRE